MRTLTAVSVCVCVWMASGLQQCAWSAEGTTGEAAHRFNRAPLQRKPYAELPLGEVRAEGWLQQQLELMAQGMTGNLDERYSAVVGPRNGWLGGDGDGWERGPYWIDGLLPLAYLLNDQKLKDKVAPWVEWTLTHQMPDGYLGPIPFETKPEDEPGLQKTPRRDWWPKMVMLKILQNHYSATGDQRVITVLDRYFRYQLRELPRTPLGHWTFWGNRRGGDNLAVVIWLYNLTGEQYLLELADLIHQQTYDHSGQWSRPDSPLTRRQGMHCVNIAQGMKHPVIYSQVDGDPKHLAATHKAFRDLDEFFGHPTGLYGADEPLNSKQATTGSEFCTAVEMLFSLEKIAEITGDVALLDRLERVAFNVLPTQATDDFHDKQYYSIVNQIHVARRQQRAHLTDHSGTDNVYGLLSGYPCCTTNLHQGWPKFTQHLWMASADDGLAALYYAPSRVTTEVQGQAVTVQEITDYPFEDAIRFRFTLDRPAQFPLHLRIPGWCTSASYWVNGEAATPAPAGQIIQVTRRWSHGDVLQLELPAQLQASRWFANAVTLQRGSLLFGLRIGESWQRVQNDDHYGDYSECHPTSPWNYGLLADDIADLAHCFQLHRRGGPLAANPWNLENAPLELRGQGQRVEQWKEVNQTAGRLSPSPVKVDQISPQPITLIPYGCTTLRITEFPVLTADDDTPDAAPWVDSTPRRLYEAAASHCWSGDHVEAIADGLEPESSADTTIPRLTFWDHRGTDEWLEARFEQPRSVDAVAVYWFDDTGFGRCRVPASWELFYRDGDDWKPVPQPESAYGVAKDQFNTVLFQAVKTTGLRIQLKLQDDFSAGVLEWRAYKSSR